MNKNTEKILLICKCGKWKIVAKADHDPKEAIYTYQWCPKCVGAGYDVNEGYYGDNGEIDMESYMLNSDKNDESTDGNSIQLNAAIKRAFYRGFDKAENDDANCYTAWREEAADLLSFIQNAKVSDATKAKSLDNTLTPNLSDTQQGEEGEVNDKA